ncbi:hypothetical protein B4088_2496 [Bacillus cereus]|uniref:Uncharacterized protein n=1 Tax=Bacillus cereus TaxID=1396 RepID=A0A164P841_BACCE|nr:hypothetical protein B4088_2496 [Bacillus cereus]
MYFQEILLFQSQAIVQHVHFSMKDVREVYTAKIVPLIHGNSEMTVGQRESI